MPTLITGPAATAATQGITAERRKLDRRDKIYELEPNKNPLVLLLRKIGKETAKSPKVEWMEGELTPTLDAIDNGAGYDENATSMVVDNGAYFFPNCLVRVQRTGEVLHVTGVSTDTLTVVRSWGGTSNQAVVDDEPLTILGGAAAEGVVAEDPRMTKKVNKFNYSQIFRDGWGATGTLEASDLYGPDYMDHEGKMRAIEHAKYIELAFWFGEQALVTSGATPRRSTGGVDEYITTNSLDINDALTETLMETAAQSAFRFGETDTRFLFCGRLTASNISLLGADRVRLKPGGNKTLGLHISRYVTTHGNWMIVPHKLFEGADYGDRAYSIDMSTLKYRYLPGRDTHVRPNIQTNDLDGFENELLTECGLERRQEQRNMALQNVII